MNNQFNDDQLKAFLKKNQPAPPPEPRGQLDQLLAKLELTRPSSSNFKHWLPLSLSGVVAASFVAAFVFLAQPKGERQTLTESPTQASESVAIDVSADENFYEEELPSLQVGGNYYELVAASEVN